MIFRKEEKEALMYFEERLPNARSHKAFPQTTTKIYKLMPVSPPVPISLAASAGASDAIAASPR